MSQPYALISTAFFLIWTAQRVPDCDMVLVHDDDLARIHEVCDSNVSRRFIPSVWFVAYP